MQKTLFWDFDGTLVHSDGLWPRCIYRALGEEVAEGGGVGISMPSLEAVGALTHTGFPWHTPLEDHRDWCGSAWWPKLSGLARTIYTRLGVPAEAAERASLRVRGLVLDASSYTVYEDARETLDALTGQGWRHFLLSNNYPELWEVVGRLGLDGCFAGCTVSGLVGYEKPRRELFAHALEQTGHPAHAVMVGDNPRADLAGAKALGMPCILVHTAPNPEALATLRTLREIPDALDRLDCPECVSGESGR